MNTICFYAVQKFNDNLFKVFSCQQKRQLLHMQEAC